jgi:hypothetical protein
MRNHVWAAIGILLVTSTSTFAQGYGGRYPGGYSQRFSCEDLLWACRNANRIGESRQNNCRRFTKNCERPGIGWNPYEGFHNEDPYAPRRRW